MTTTTTPAALPPLRTNPNFRRVFLAGAVSKLGNYVGYVAMPLVAVLALNAGPAEVGALAALDTLAFLLIGLPTGVWVDRLRRRPVMIVTDLARAVLLLSIPVAWWFGALSLAQLFTVVLLMGVCTVFFDVANQSFLPTVVDRASLTSANSALVAFDAITVIGGRSGGGYLVELLTAPVALLVDAFGYLWSACFVWRIKVTEPRPDKSGTRNLRQEVAQGVRHVFGHRLLRPIAISGAANNLFTCMTLTILPIVFIDELGFSAAALGLFFAIGGLGAFLGAALARRIGDGLGTGRAMWLVGACLSPFALVVPLLSDGPGYWVAAAAFALMSASPGVDNVLKISFRQRVTPDELLGRMNATFRFLLTGAIALGAAAAGVIGELVDVWAVLWIGAIGTATTWLILFFSPLRRLRVLPE